MIRRYRWLLLLVLILVLSLSFYYSVLYSRVLRGDINAAVMLESVYESELISLDQSIVGVDQQMDLVEAKLASFQAELDELAVDAEKGAGASVISRRAVLHAAIQELKLMRQQDERIRELHVRQQSEFIDARDNIRIKLGELKRVHILVGLSPWILSLLLLSIYYLYRNQIRAAFERLHPVGYCRICFYDLEGNQSGVCPECGTAVVAETHAATNLQS